MKDITDKIFDIKRNSIYVDSLKADYMMDMEVLMDYIFESNCEMQWASDERIEEKVNHLILFKEELVTELIKFINEVNELDHELHIWRHQNENR